MQGETVNATSFNRTIVELKPSLASKLRGCNKTLLIEPLWNWNVVSSVHVTVVVSAFNRTIVELKPQRAKQYGSVIHPFNRTIVELKRRQFDGLLKYPVDF